jgi:uncharacterized Fe-S center protein
VQWCPVSAILLKDRKALIDYETCYGCGECVASCPHGAIGVQFQSDATKLQEKIVEHCVGAVAGKEGKVVYVSFLTNMSPDCDCWNFSDAAVVPDLGVLASMDPVAIDQAACDLVNAAQGLPGSRGEGLAAGADKFKEVTGIDGDPILAYAEKMGLGTRRYRLETLEQ